MIFDTTFYEAKKPPIAITNGGLKFLSIFQLERIFSLSDHVISYLSSQLFGIYQISFSVTL